MLKLQILSKCFSSLSVFLTHFALQMQACNNLMIHNCKLLTVFQGKFKLTNQSYSPSKISLSINIKWRAWDS